MKPVIGKRYKTRDGRTATITKYIKAWGGLWEGKIAGVDPLQSFYCWNDKGEDCTSADRALDLVRELKGKRT